MLKYLIFTQKYPQTLESVSNPLKIIVKHVPIIWLICCHSILWKGHILSVKKIEIFNSIFKLISYQNQ